MFYLPPLVLYFSCPLLILSSTPLVLYSSTPLVLYSSCPLLLFYLSSTPLVLYSSCPLLFLPCTPLLLVLYSSCPLLLLSSTPLVLYSSCPLLLYSSCPLLLLSATPLVLYSSTTLVLYSSCHLLLPVSTRVGPRDKVVKAHPTPSNCTPSGLPTKPTFLGKQQMKFPPLRYCKQGYSKISTCQFFLDKGSHEISALTPYALSHNFFRICTTAYQALSSTQPTYLTSMLAPARNSRLLRSMSSNPLYIPRVKTKVGTHAFSVAAPTLWNTLPASVILEGNIIFHSTGI